MSLSTFTSREYNVLDGRQRLGRPVFETKSPSFWEGLSGFADDAALPHQLVFEVEVSCRRWGRFFGP